MLAQNQQRFLKKVKRFTLVNAVEENGTITGTLGGRTHPEDMSQIARRKLFKNAE